MKIEIYVSDELYKKIKSSKKPVGIFVADVLEEYFNKKKSNPTPKESKNKKTVPIKKDK